MKIGYPCINRSIGCTTNRTFRLANFTGEKFIEIASQNLSCLMRVLEYNVEHGIYFFRISSDIIPFASHPICTIDWQNYFEKELRAIGNFIKSNNIRVSMHPDQFVLLNSPNPKVVEASIAELIYHQNFLDSLNVGYDAVIQIHVGGVYNNKKSAIKNFITHFRHLPIPLQKRLVIENDERLYSVADCLEIHASTGIAILFDYFHHQCLNNGENLTMLLREVFKTWWKNSHPPIVDYSSQHPTTRLGKHADKIDPEDFAKFLTLTKDFDFDIMLEIKDKEKSALKALAIAREIVPEKLFKLT